jgi:Uncharacterized conserved protein (DUF2164)
VSRCVSGSAPQESIRISWPRTRKTTSLSRCGGSGTISVQFSDEARKQAAASLQRYCAEELDIELTGIQQPCW